MKLKNKDEIMLLEDRINKVLEHGESRSFMQSQLSTIRDNILEAEKRISKLFLLILSLIGLSLLIEYKLIKKIDFLRWPGSLDLSMISIIFSHAMYIK